MNKIFTKIASLALGAAMAFGVGVAVSSKEASPAHAATAGSAYVEDSVVSAGGSISTGASDYYVLKSTGGYYYTGVSSGWGGVSTSLSSAVLLTLSGNASGFTIYDTAASAYLTYTAKSFTTGASGTSLIVGTGTVSGTDYPCVQNGTTGVLKSNTGSSNKLRWYAGTSYATNMLPVQLIKVKTASVAATINGSSSVNVGTEWTPTSITENVSGNTVTGATYAFAASGGAVISSSSTSTGAFTCSAAGTVTVSATKSGYTIASKTVTVNSADPYINLTLTSGSPAYTGQTVTITAAYGNGVAGLNWSVQSGSISGSATTSNSGYSAKIGNTAGTLTIRATDTGSATYSEVSVTVTKTAFTTSPAASASVKTGKTTTLTAVLNSGGTINWDSDDTSVATVSAAGVVTGVAEGTATITAQSADDTSVTAECEVTVSAAPLSYDITGPAQTQANGNGASVSNLNTWYPIDSEAYIEWTAVTGSIYGSSSSAIRFGTSTASATGSMTLSLKTGAPIYFVGVTVNAKTWSTETGNTLQVNNQTASVTTDWDDYDFDIASDVTSITIGNGTKRVNVYAINVYYAYKTPELHASLTDVDAAINTSNTSINLTAENYTPTSYTAVVKSGSSLTATAVAFNTSSTPHTATFTTGATTGTTVFTITGTGGGKSASVEVSVTVTNPRNLTALSITTASDATTFKVGETFDVGSLVITATFDAAPTTVVYSKANDNLAALEASPEIGYEFVEGDIGSMSAEFQLSVGTGTKSVSYTITVADKDYATAVTDLDSLWDGQKVYFSNGTNAAMNKYSSGNNVGASSATIDSTKGLDIAGTSGYAYTVHRMKVDSTVYYLFSLEESGTTYYIKDTGTSSTNSINKVTDISDTAIYWTLSAGSNDGQWTITNRSNTTKAYLQINPNNGNPLLSCYNGGNTDPYLYAVTSYSESAVAADFAAGAMHMSENTSGQCVDYYPIAKQVWNAMSEDERLYVDEEQPLAYARLVAWAAYHGETINGSYNIVSASRISILNTTIGKNGNTVAIIVIVSMISVTAIGGYFFLRKRKEI